MKFWRKREESLNDEIRDYIDRETQLNIEAGLDPAGARYAAQRKLGSSALVKENTRISWGWTWLERLWQDVQYAARTMSKNPGFTLVAVLSLAIGIGANSAMFSLADALILRPLPVPHPSEVLTIGFKASVDHFSNVGASYPDYIDFRDKSKSFDGLIAYTNSTFGFSRQADATPKLKLGAFVSSNFFPALGVDPEFGRGFRPDEDRVGADPVAILSHDLWETQLGADPAILGQKIRLSGIDCTVIGIAPERFTGMDQYFRPAFYLPIAMWPRFVNNPKDKPLEARDDRQLTVKGRLKPGVTIAQAQAELTVISKALEKAYPATNRNKTAVVQTEFQKRFEQSPIDAELSAMLLLLALAVLLVACANVAGLLLSRAPVRSREIALRLAIGASRPRLIRQLLTESLLMALAGGLLGLAFGYAGAAFMSRLQPQSDLPIQIDIKIDERALLFSLCVSVASAILFGLIPALKATRADLAPALRTAGADTPHQPRLLGRNALVAVQVALSMVLLMVSTEIYHGFREFLANAPGFRADHLFMMSFDPGVGRYNEARTQQFFRDIRRQAERVAGVRSAALASAVPLDGVGLGASDIFPEGYEFPKGQDKASLFDSSVDENYFETMEIPIVRGRAFRPTDKADAPRVAIVNEELAKHYWKGSDPIGKRFRLNKSDGPWIEIVGLAKTTKYLWIGEGPVDFVYFPMEQQPPPQMTLFARSSVNPSELAAPLRQVVRALDANQPVFNARSYEDFYKFRAESQPTTIVQTIAAMGAMGLVLAMVGLYGLVAYSATRRRREIGIRMAIGASPATVLKMVLRQGLILSLIGVAIGFAASFGVSPLLNAVFQTTGRDLLAYFVVTPALILITALAVFIPARRASHVDPMRVLRYE